MTTPTQESVKALADLADRVEAAAERSRELDGMIQKAMGPDFPSHYSGVGVCNAFTASIDAAMTLVPEGWDHMEVYRPDHQALGWTVHIMPNANLPRVYWTGFAQTYALALTAAALRARAAHLGASHD